MGKKRTSAVVHKASATAAVAAGGGEGGAADENNVSLASGLVPGSTLEDYFHSSKFTARKDAPVSKHLLVGSPTNNAMAVERVDETEEAVGNDPELAPRRLTATSETLGDVAGTRGGHRRTSQSDEKERDGSGGRDAERADEQGGEHEKGEHHKDEDAKAASNHDEYEDDYESESPSPDTSVAGMTLSDYLHAKEAKNLEDEGGQAAEAKRVTRKPHHEPVVHPAAAPKVSSHAGASKKPNPPVLVTGMSLDHYLGASSSTEEHDLDDGDPYDSGADSKSPTSKRKKSKHKLGAKSLPTKPAVAGATCSTGSFALAQDDHATPFQKRQSKKLKAKLRQQQQTGGGAVLVSKAILLADSSAAMATTLSPSLSSQSLLLQPKGAVSLSKDRKKLSPHPLPKLVASSPSAHTLLHDVDGSGSDGDSSGESEKLPPLAHH